MSTSDFDLALPPTDPRERELWLQHAAGFILFEDARQYARDQLDPGLDDAARQAAHKAIDDTMYGLMMVIDGVTGALTNAELSVTLQVSAQLTRRRVTPDGLVQHLNLAEGDGMCMGYHFWRAGDFGANDVAVRKPK